MLGFVVSQPRFAPAGPLRGLRWRPSPSLTRAARGPLLAFCALVLGLLLAVPSSIAHPTRRAALDRAVAGPAMAPAPAVAERTQINVADISPSAVSTSQPPSAGIKPVVQPINNGGLLGPAGETGELGIPTMVLKAYKLAAAELAKEQPACHLPWWLLAGIGHTESGHAESGRLYSDGTTRGRILGPRLNGGIAGDAVITDTDHGLYDGDTQYDRAVGPMQFIPSTWRSWGADGNHDGKKDPNNIFDATLAAGRYLCADGRNLATKAGLQAAVLSYNHSQAYLDTVLAWGYAYRSGASALPDQTTPVVGDVTKVRPPLSARPPHKPIKLPAKRPASSPSTGPTGPPSSGPTGSPTGSSPVSASPTCSSATPSASVSGSATGSASGSAGAGDTSSAAAGTDAATASALASADGSSATGTSGVSDSASATGSASSSTGASSTPSCTG